MEKSVFSLMLANHWSYTGIGWQLGLESCVQSVEDSMNLADRPPHVKVCINLDAQAYRLIRLYFPDTADRLQRYLKEGKVELIGGTFGQPMGSMMGNESNIRQLVYGRKAVKEALDYDLRSFLEEEEFTFPQLPQLLSLTGYQYASLAQCDTWGNTGVPRFQESRILWKGPDGTQIPAATRSSLYFHPPMVTKDVTALLDTQKEELLDRCRKEKNPLATVWTEFGWEPITSHTMNCFHEEYYAQLKETYGVSFVTLGEYMDQTASERDPVREIGYEDFHKLLPWGVGGDQLRVYDREIEGELLSAEKLNVISSFLGGACVQERLDRAWEDLLVSQSHDVSLCEYTRWGGGLFPPANMVLNHHSQQWGALGYRHMDSAAAAARQVIQGLSREIVEKIRPFSVENLLQSFYVFHLLEYPEIKRVLTQKLCLAGPVTRQNLCLLNDKEEEISFSLVDCGEKEDGTLTWVQLCFAADLPAMGYAGYCLVSGNTPKQEEKRIREQTDCYILENDFFVGKVSKKNGALTSLVCKETGEETIDPAGPFPEMLGQPVMTILTGPGTQNFLFVVLLRARYRWKS